MKKYLFLLTCSLIAAPLAAQDTGSPDDTGDNAGWDAGWGAGRADGCCQTAAAHVSPITVVATGTPIEIEDTGQAVTVIEREEIESVQGEDIARILRRAPGVTLSRNGGLGGFTGLRVRGAAAEQVLVLVDGARVSDPASPAGGFDFGNLLPGTVAAIDLLRGSNSTIWGSDAVGGVLSVATRAETGVEGSMEYGSRDTFSANLAGGLEGSAGFVGLAGGYTRTDGFSSAAAGRERDGFEQFALSARGTANLGATTEAFASVRYARGELEIDGFPAPSFTLGDTGETQETRQYSGAIGVARDNGPLFLQARYSFADTQRDNFDPAIGSDRSFASDGHSDRVDLRGEWRPIGPLIVNFGGESEWTRYQTQTDPGEDARIMGAYAQAGIEFGAVSGHLGLRHDDHDRFGGATSFGADLSYEVADNVRLRASIGEGFKAPTLFQLYSDFGNETLRPEKSTSFDLGIALANRNASDHAAITVFRRDSEDLVDFASCFGVTDPICTDRPFGTYANIGRARAQGIEVEAGKEVFDGGVLRAVYAFIDTQDRTPGAANQGNRLARRPRHAVTLSGDVDTDPATPFGLRLGFDLRYVSASFDDAGNTVRLDDYAVFDLRASRALLVLDEASQQTLELFARIENVFDADYQTAAGYAQAGRGAFGGLRARF